LSANARVRVGFVVVAAAIIGLLWLGLAYHRSNGATAAAVYSGLPASPAPALRIGRPLQLTSGRYLSRWAVVRTATVVHARPTTSSTAIATLDTLTADDTPNGLIVVRTKVAANGALWVEVRLPILPNGTTGWVRRQALGGYQTVDTHLVVDRERLRASLYRAGRLVFSAPVAIGTSASPTPAGQFMVKNELTRYASAFYGPVAFGTTARSPVLTDWPGGGFIGIHGTNLPQLIPGRVSHGCIRMRNPDILRLAALLPVGTPLTVR
jgi:L,D-transpeptidase-like protein